MRRNAKNGHLTVYMGGGERRGGGKIDRQTLGAPVLWHLTLNYAKHRIRRVKCPSGEGKGCRGCKTKTKNIEKARDGELSVVPRLVFFGPFGIERVRSQMPPFAANFSLIVKTHLNLAFLAKINLSEF